MALTDTVLEIAAKEVGVRESPANWGPRVRQYLAAVGIHRPGAWCAAFVWWCLTQAAAQLQRPGLLAAFQGITPAALAYVPNLQTWARREGVLRSSPRPTDLFLSLRPSGIARHVGFVAAVEADTFTTYEGNSNAGGSAEGIGVFHNTRRRRGRYAFIRWADLVDEAEAPATERKLYLSGKPICSMPEVEGRCMCPVRTWLQALGFKDSAIGWEDGSVTLEGKELDVDVEVLGAAASAPIRQLADQAGLEILRVTAQGVWVGRPEP